ncbi:MAG TPA: hypothetical protein PKJ97_00265 [Candidatus Bilamarchaeaceae archaeon]|nr:hypothetical protein [Candidatus Bilamarchaeaceae archaeon]
MSACNGCKKEISNPEIAFVPLNALPHREPPNFLESLFDMSRPFRFQAYHEKCLVESQSRFLEEYFSKKERPRGERMEFWVFRKYSSLLDMLLLRGFVYLLVGMFLFFGGVQILLFGGAGWFQLAFAVFGVLAGAYVLGRGVPSLTVFLLNVFYRSKGSEK